MKLKKLIEELLSITNENPKRSEQEVYIYIQDINDVGPGINNIILVDNDIDDRVDINI
jgi:hypothetical protein